VRVALRHRAAQRHRVDDAVLDVGDLRIDVAHHRVTVGERAVDLTPKEFQFLTALARYPGRVVTHRALLDEVWGPGVGDTQYLRVCAGGIRKKLADKPGRARLVTEPGVGFRLIDPAGDEPAAQPSRRR
jgi:two-component system KDP operon response regulator KdpE